MLQILINFNWRGLIIVVVRLKEIEWCLKCQQSWGSIHPSCFHTTSIHHVLSQRCFYECSTICAVFSCQTSSTCTSTYSIDKISCPRTTSQYLFRSITKHKAVNTQWRKVLQGQHEADSSAHSGKKHKADSSARFPLAFITSPFITSPATLEWCWSGSTRKKKSKKANKDVAFISLMPSPRPTLRLDKAE